MKVTASNVHRVLGGSLGRTSEGHWVAQREYGGWDSRGPLQGLPGDELQLFSSQGDLYGFKLPGETPAGPQAAFVESRPAAARDGTAPTGGGVSQMEMLAARGQADMKASPWTL